MENEHIVDYGVVDGIPYVVTEAASNDGLNLPRTKYVGDEIPEQFIKDIAQQKKEAEETSFDVDRFNKFNSHMSKRKVLQSPREEYIEGFEPPNIDAAKQQKGAERLSTFDNLKPERFTQLGAEDVQINPTDTYQETKPPENVENQGKGSGAEVALGEINK